MNLKHPFHLTPAVAVLLGFFGLILTGTLLLMLPIASTVAGTPSFLTTLFTATSSTCVTGLIAVDTATSWTMFGQIVILLLIQIGGMGIVTVAVMLNQIAGRRIGLTSRFFLQESIGAPQLGGIIRLLRFILRTAFVMEGIGACLLAIRFIPEFGPLRGIWYSIFHAISAFCNAGFDLMGYWAPCSSMTKYYSDPLVLGTLMLMVVLGGIGFFVWDDVARNHHHVRQYTLQTKVILTTTAVLLIGPFLWFWLCEFIHWDQLSHGQQVLSALFQTVSPRTAGFNSVELNQLGGGSKLLTILLMLVGGSPSSTAGGIKTTTLAVLLLALRAGFTSDNEIHIYGRRIPASVITRTLVVSILYATLFLSASLILTQLEPVTMVESLFECASAIATVGLTLGITGGLGAASKVILILLMYLGRVGGLTLVYAVTGGRKRLHHTLPEESIGIG